MPLGITYIQRMIRMHAPDVYILVCPKCASESPMYDIRLDVKVKNIVGLTRRNLARSDSETDLTIGWNTVRKKKLVNRILDRTKDADRSQEIVDRRKWSGNFFRDIVSLVNV